MGVEWDVRKWNLEESRDRPLSRQALALQPESETLVVLLPTLVFHSLICFTLAGLPTGVPARSCLAAAAGARLQGGRRGRRGGGVRRVRRRFDGAPRFAGCLAARSTARLDGRRRGVVRARGRGCLHEHAVPWGCMYANVSIRQNPSEVFRSTK